MCHGFKTLVGVLQDCVSSSLLLFIVKWNVVMTLADAEDARIVVSGSRISNLLFVEYLAIMAGVKSMLEIHQ